MTHQPDNTLAAVAARLAAVDDHHAREVIAQLQEQIEASPVQMAVVDYIGFSHQNAKGQFVTIDRLTPERIRFGTRCMAHVAVYGITVLAYNPATLAALDAT